MRCTAPMNAPSPPPTMPRRMRARFAVAAARLRWPCPAPSAAQHARDLRLVGAPPAKSSNAFSVTRMMWPRDEGRALARALLGMLQAALPFQHRPAVDSRTAPSWRRCRRNRSGRRPANGSARRARPRAGSRNRRPGGRRAELGVLHVEGLDALVVDVDERQIVELLQQEVRRVVVDVAARMAVDRVEEHLEGGAVEQVLAGMDLVADVDAGLVEGVEDRPPAPASSSKAVSIRPGGRCGQG